MRWRPMALMCATIVWCGAASAAERPNILWLVAEDATTTFGCYGDPVAKTPNIDRLAREGIVFDRCFTQAVCAPSRFMLISGMYPTSCGPAEHMRAQGKIPDWLKGFPSYLREAGYFTTNCQKTDYNSPISVKEAWDECRGKAHYSHRSDSSQPFFAVFNHEVCHESCLFPEKSRGDGRIDPATVRIPPYQPDTPELRADWARMYECQSAMDRQIGEKLKELKESGQAENTIVFFYGDNGGIVARSKRFLQRSGTNVAMVAYFPKKWQHLAPAPPGSRLSDPVSFVDFAPTVLSLAGIEPPKYMHGLAFAGKFRAPANEFVFCSRDRMDERYDMMRMVADRKFLYIRNYRPDRPYVQSLNYMFQARGYQSWAEQAAQGKLTRATAQFWGEKPSEELYDLDADPDNVKNLVADPARADTLSRMRAELKRRVLLANDNGFLPEGSQLEGYDASRKTGAYPIERVFEIANVASDRKVENLPKLIEALADPCEPIRWWGAQGCSILGQRAAKAEPALQKCLGDASGPVATAAAEAIARLGKIDQALPILERYLADDNEFTALQAANVLLHLCEKAKPSLPAIQKLASARKKSSEKGGGYLHRILPRIIAVLEGREKPLVYPDMGPK